MQELFIKDEYIKLGQALKLAGLVSSGIEAKIVIQDGLVKKNDVTTYERGKKCYNGDIISFNDMKVVIKNDN